MGGCNQLGSAWLGSSHGASWQEGTLHDPQRPSEGHCPFGGRLFYMSLNPRGQRLPPQWPTGDGMSTLPRGLSVGWCHTGTGLAVAPGWGRAQPDRWTGPAQTPQASLLLPGGHFLCCPPSFLTVPRHCSIWKMGRPSWVWSGSPTIHAFKGSSLPVHSSSHPGLAFGISALHVASGGSPVSCLGWRCLRSETAPLFPT